MLGAERGRKGTIINGSQKENAFLRSNQSYCSVFYHKQKV